MTTPSTTSHHTRKLWKVYLYSKPEQENEKTNLVDLYFKDIKHNKVLSPKEEKALALKVKQWDEQAKEEFISSNLKLVVSVAKKYLFSCLSFWDLIQEGNLWLLKAVDKFDPELDYKFSTYATFWINQSITTAIANSWKTVGVPIHVVDDISKYHKATQVLFDKLWREATNEEIRNYMWFNEEKFQKLMEVLPSHLSLDKKIWDEDWATAGELMEDKSTLTPDIEAETAIFKEELYNLMSDILTERENTIMRYRYWFNWEDKVTLENVWDLFWLTRERVRQLEKQSILKLRENQRFQQLIGV